MHSSNTISILIATRKRTESLGRLFDSIVKTCHDINSLEILLAIDEDDIETSAYINRVAPTYKLKIKPIIEKRGKGYIDLHKRVTTLCRKSEGNFLFFLPDDVEFDSNDWDERILATYNKAYHDNIYWVNTRHNEENNPYAMCFAITKNWFKITGHLGTCYHQDTEFNYVARHVGRMIYLKDISIIHHRPIDHDGTLEGEIDQTYIEGRLAADSGQLKGRSITSVRVQSAILLDAIKLLKRISTGASEEENSEISAQIRHLRWEFMKVQIANLGNLILTITPKFMRHGLSRMKNRIVTK